MEGLAAHAMSRPSARWGALRFAPLLTNWTQLSLFYVQNRSSCILLISLTANMRLPHPCPRQVHHSASYWSPDLPGSTHCQETKHTPALLTSKISMDGW
jgi:hypothetical protein